jgi:hypothetical protein
MPMPGRNEPTSRILRQIQRAAGLDPDGPPRPMQAPLSHEQVRREIRRFAEVATRDAMLRRALRLLW